MSKAQSLFNIFLFLLAALFFGLWRLDKARVTAQTQQASAKTILQHPQAAPVKQFKDTAGDEHIEILAGGEIPQNVLDDTAVTNRTQLDSFARAVSVKDDRILELTRENIDIQAENLQLKAQHDTDGATFYSYTDKHLSLQYFPEFNRASLKYQVNITTGKFTPGSWWPFSRQAPLLDLSADDSRATINNVDHVLMQVPQPRFGFLLDAKAWYAIDSKTITPSLGADLRLGRFHLSDRFYYDSKLKQVPGLSYDILKLGQ